MKGVRSEDPLYAKQGVIIVKKIKLNNQAVGPFPGMIVGNAGQIGRHPGYHR